jgi:hypothetical protein
LTPGSPRRIVSGRWEIRLQNSQILMQTSRQRRQSALWAAFTLATPVAVAGEEYCVTCAGPDATYRCLIGGEAPPASHSSRGQFLCITELAKAGGHSSCSAARGQATPCAGETRTVMYSLADPNAPPQDAAAPQAHTVQPPAASPPPGQLAPVALPPANSPGEPYAPPPAETGAAPAPQQPKPNAVEDLANKTGKAVSDTGKAVGNAVKKSWDCVASLFGKC